MSQVLLRHVLGPRTWCALPVTVLSDGPNQAVLRIQAGTEWVAAYGPDGRRAHGWQRRWRLRRSRWHGHDGTYVVEWGRWYGIAVFTDPRTRHVHKWYVNCQDPLRRTAWGFDTMDRELDIELCSAEGERPRWKDMRQFNRLIRSGALGAHTARLIIEDARQAKERLADPGVRAALHRWTVPCDGPPDLTHVLSCAPLPSDLRPFATGSDTR